MTSMIPQSLRSRSLLRPTLRPASPLLSALLSLAMLSVTACDGEDGGDETGDETGGEEQALEIIGDYVDDFSTEHSITQALWTFAGSNFLLGEFDNANMWVVGRNDDANMFNPGLWSRFDWAMAADQLYYCQSVFDGETVEDAKAGGADSGDLAAGCGGFPWSMLTPR